MNAKSTIKQNTNAFPIEVLLIVNSPQNIDLAIQVLDKTKCTYNFHVVNSITETAGFLRKEGNYGNKPKPDVIFIDSDTALYFEKELLQEMNGNKTFSNIPVLFLKSIEDKIKITKAINMQSINRATKELDINNFMESIASLKKFAGSLVKLTEYEN